MPPPPASGDLNSHPQLSAWRSSRIRVPSLKFVGLPVSKIWLIFGHGVKRPGVLGTGAEYQPWHGQPSCQFWCCEFSLSSYGRTYIRLTTFYLITSTFDLWRHRACHSIPSLRFVGLPFGRYGAFSVSSLIGLETLTVELLILNGVTGHRVMGFLPTNFQLATPFRSRLSVRHGTDRRTDRRRPSTLNALTVCGRGIINGWR